jgi:hypothetical protein
MNRVWEASRQSVGALLVLLAIADFADDDGIAYPSIGTLARKARLSPRQVQRVIADLVAASELIVQPGGGRQGSHLFRVAVGREEGKTQVPRQNVTPDNLSPPPRHRRREGVTPASGEGVTPATPEPSYREPSGTVTPLPPSADGPQQQQGDGEERRVEQGTAPAGLAPPGPPSPARLLVEALYRALGVELDQLTPAIRTRELAIADQLVRVGATPAEAEAYARETGALGQRLAPIDLRSFERERASWLARRRGSLARGRYVDRTGQGIVDEPITPPMQRTVADEATASKPGSHKPAAEALPPPHGRTGEEPASERLSAPLDWTTALRRRLEGTD